jgi:hypothetical protein
MNKSVRRYISLIIYSISFVLFIATEGAGQALTIGGGNQTLTITTGIAGGQLVNVVNINTTLTYTTPRLPRQNWRMTVSASCPGQRFNLSVLATNVTAGVAAPAVTLITGNPAIDFITAIPRRMTNATCRLQYTASATFDEGNSSELGNDVYTVTYTLLTP